MAYRELSVVIAAFFLGTVIFGCASVKEGTRGLLGVSTKNLLEKRPEALSRTFMLDYKSCSLAVEQAIKDMKAYVYARDKKNNLIAVYVSEEDTTAVGIFLTTIDIDTIKVEVSSASTSAKELISQKLFQTLEKGQ